MDGKLKDGKLKLLFMSASPVKLDEVRTDVELRDITERVRAAVSPDRFEIAVATATRRDQLQQLVLTHGPDIVHFAGHGDSKRGILLEDGRGNTASVSGPALASLFSLIRGKPRIVVLNACSTKRTARAFQHIVDYTIAMNGPIRDISAIAFASAFYEGLARGLHVPGAFGAGLSQLQLLKLPSKTTPELFIAPGVQLETPPPHGDARRESDCGTMINMPGAKTHDVISVGGRGNTLIVKGSRR